LANADIFENVELLDRRLRLDASMGEDWEVGCKVCTPDGPEHLAPSW
jgi:hypothetical protein